jgi:hypothetical protein
LSQVDDATTAGAELRDREIDEAVTRRVRSLDCAPKRAAGGAINAGVGDDSVSRRVDDVNLDKLSSYWNHKKEQGYE